MQTDEQLEIAALKAEIAKWKDYTGCDTPQEAYSRTDPYNEHDAKMYHRVRIVFQRYTDKATGTAHIGWGDYGDPMPVLTKVLDEAGYALREGHDLPDKYFDGTLHQHDIKKLYDAAMHRPPSVSVSTPTSNSSFWELGQKAQQKPPVPVPPQLLDLLDLLGVQQTLWDEGLEAACLQAQDKVYGLQETPMCVRNLLAVVHRDGGHYLAQHGLDKACSDAEAVYHDLRRDDR